MRAIERFPRLSLLCFFLLGFSMVTATRVLPQTTRAAIPTLAASTHSGSVIYVRAGGAHPPTPAGIQSAINQAHANGGGHVILAPTNGNPIPMGSRSLLLYSNVRVSGAGRDVTVLEWSGDVNAIIIGGNGLQNATLEDMSLLFDPAASTNSAALRLVGGDGAGNLVWYNTFQNLHIIFNSSAGSTTAGIYATSTGSATDIVLNVFSNIWVDGANQFAQCNGCEGNFWQSVLCSNCGWNVGAVLFQEGALEADENVNARMESGSGNPVGVVCYSTTGSNNIVRLTCDANNSGVTALRDTAGYNIFDVDTVGSPTLGTVSATSSCRYVASGTGTSIKF